MAAAMSSDDHEQSPERRAVRQAKQGLGLLWRAARGAARGLRGELEGSKLSRTLDEAVRTAGDAGQELVRAAESVAGRVGSELQKAGFEVERRLRSPRGDDAASSSSEDPPRGPTQADPGFRIAAADEEHPRKDREDGGAD